MTGLGPESESALQPVRKALRAAAEELASGIRGDAAREAAGLLDAARAEAAGILAGAAKEGESAARLEAAMRSARVRRQAHELVLAQRNSLRVELHRRVREAAAGLTSDSRYAGMMIRLTSQCKELLGPDASVSESPEGGVIAHAGSRRLDLSLPVLAEMALDSMPGARELWNR
ncbi:hypothetical protein GCM10023063_00660 [Arthrobacter methylotrophus]|uniref:V-type ATP synthase subunit E n=1 Tax=Arthrobacter methylotrophus TaxID=121291 RepID=A0ABV5UWR6_9MICC